MLLETCRLFENSFPYYVLPLLEDKPSLPNLLLMTLTFVSVYCRPHVLVPRWFVPVLFIWDYFMNIWCTHGPRDLGRHFVLQSTSVLSLTLVTCGRSVPLQLTLAFTLRQMLLNLIEHAESVAFSWTKRRVLPIYYHSSSTRLLADCCHIFYYLLAVCWLRLTVKRTAVEYINFISWIVPWNLRSTFVSSWATRCFEVSNAIQKVGRLFSQELLCGLLKDFTRTNTPTLFCCTNDRLRRSEGLWRTLKLDVAYKMRKLAARTAMLSNARTAEFVFSDIS